MVPTRVSEAAVRAACDEAYTRLKEVHLRPFAGSDGPVVYISDTYPGVWLEHVFDGVVWATLTGEAGVAVAEGDPMAGNCWGYWCQGLTMLRSLRWMKACGLTAELHENMQKWLAAWTDSELRFGQELDPFTGKPSVCSPYYSSTMLFFLAAAKELGYWSL